MIFENRMHIFIRTKFTRRAANPERILPVSPKTQLLLTKISRRTTPDLAERIVYASAPAANRNLVWRRRMRRIDPAKRPQFHFLVQPLIQIITLDQKAMLTADEYREPANKTELRTPREL
jgi:uncharacterized protein YpiB (UPF0302 family)